MRTNKVLLGSLALAAAFTACTNDELVEGFVNETSRERAQVNLTLNAPSVESRMTAGESGWGTGYTTNDVLGAVLVDAGYTDAVDDASTVIWNNVDWAVVSGHVGNNRWAFKDGKFRTDGTTSVGAWLFYTKYNSKMTTTRNGVEFDFPQIQDGASNFEKLQNNNINFQISPVVAIDGYEGDNLAFDIAMVTVYNKLRMPFDFSGIEGGVNEVQKIVVTAMDATGNPVKFPSQYRVVNKNLPLAKTSEATDAPEEIKVPALSSQADQMSKARTELIYGKVDWTTFTAANYEPAVETRDASKYYEYLVVDLDEEHTDVASTTGGLAVAEDGKFSAVMFMPAGVYHSITFKLYTDNGVYEKTVDCRNAYAENVTENKPEVSGQNLIFLRPNYHTVLSDIENVIELTNTAETLTDEEYIKIKGTDRKAGDLITKTADLIDFINGIDKAESYNVNILTQGQIGGENDMDDEAFAAHTVVINKAVMDAVVAKEEALSGDIQLVFKGLVDIKGGSKAAEALEIHDLTFDEGANLIEGFAKATSDVVVSKNKKMTVKSGSTLDIDMDNTEPKYLYQVDVESTAKLNVNSTNTIYKIQNNGSVVVGSTGNLTVAVLPNYGTVNNRKVLTINSSWVNYEGAKLTNTGIVNIEKRKTDNQATAMNNGEVITNGSINVHGIFVNKGAITNGANGDIVVNSTETGAFNNAKGATIVNKGEIYTTTAGSNTIENLGTIDAWAGSRTWITTNSSADEKAPANNGTAGVTMGVIKLAKRNTNAVVTTPNNQGYKEYTVAEGDLVEGVLMADAKDLFNKVILSAETELSADLSYVRFIETSKDLTLPKGAKIQELKFTGDAALYTGIPSKKSERVVVSSLTINENVTLDIMDKNELYVYTISTIATSQTLCTIKNYGKLMLGGNLYTQLLKPEAAATSPNGVFGSGHGDDTAYQWGYTY